VEKEELLVVFSSSPPIVKGFGDLLRSIVESGVYSERDSGETPEDLG
jgi:hypothetical protein